MAVFELPAADVVVELVVRRQNNSSNQPLSSSALAPAAEANAAPATVTDPPVAAGSLKRSDEITAQAVRMHFFSRCLSFLFVQSNE